MQAAETKGWMQQVIPRDCGGVYHVIVTTKLVVVPSREASEEP